MKSAFLLAAPHSGAGKTTITLALLAALKARGLRVQSFKCGPDYIDPLHHAKITHRPSHNLDTWMLAPEAVRKIYQERSGNADVSLVEGVMGLFDGAIGTSPEGSSSHLANKLGLPVILVVDARSMARSAAALVKGFVEFDPNLSVAGIIWNRVGSPSHRRILDEACAQANLPPVVGCFYRDESLALGERHLGLVTPDDAKLPAHWIDHLAKTAEEAVEIDKLLALTRRSETTGLASAPRKSAEKTIAVARDRAFCFYYEENFAALEELGAKLLYFSPVEGDAVPEADALYLGGGYPELHAEAISKNTAFIDSVRSFHRAGKPIYAECGGFMTLCESISGNGVVWSMAGIFPTGAVMGSKMARLGYREVTGAAETPVAGLTARGHEFHYSTVRKMPEHVTRAFSLKNARGEPLQAEGYLLGSALGGYVHLHFRSNPEMVRALFRL